MRASANLINLRSGPGRALGAILVCGWGATGARAQTISVSNSAPVVDRYMYVFGSEQGTRALVPAFASLTASNAATPGSPPPTDARFDDRDGQYLLGFSTAGSVPTGLDLSRYQVLSARIVVRLAIEESDLAFPYDPTFDSWRSHLFAGDATHPADANYVAKDPGAPLELFGVAFRNGFTQFTFTNTSPYKPGGQAFPWINNRNAYPIGFSDGGATLDASNTLKAQTDVLPLANATAANLASGDLVPGLTDFTFEIDLSRAGNLAYVRQGLAAGRLTFLITTLTPASEMGAAGVTYPVFYTSRAFDQGYTSAAGPRLELSVSLCRLDYNQDGSLNPDDIGDFITDYFTLPPIAGPGGYSIACPGNSGPYVNGYRAAYTSDGAGQCGEPNPDNLGDWITDYFLGC